MGHVERARILVVDDDGSARALIRTALELDGYTVCEAAAADEGLSAVRESRPDLVILDLSLPGRQGLDVLIDLRDDPALHSIPVVVLTATADEGTEQRARDLGASSYVAKPVSVDDLERVVRQALDAR